MREPSIRTSRLVIAAGLAAAIMVGGGGFLLGRRTAPQPAPPAPVAPPPVPAPKPEAERLLRRADLVMLARDMADAWSTRGAPPIDLHRLAGRRFELVLPFGCGGPTGPDERSPMQWSYDAEAQRLRVSVAPTRWEAADWGYDPADGRQAEGFWIARPWSSSERCPAGGTPSAPVGTEPITLPGQSLAVAQFLPAGSESLLARGGRPMEVVRRVAPADLDPAAGFRVRITGRIERDPEPGRCVQPGGTEQRPICLLKVRMDEIRIENGADDGVLGRWAIASVR